MSPYGLIQERLPDDEHRPWRVIVCCILLNQTSGRQVRPIVDGFFRLCPTPEALLDEFLGGELRTILEPLGLVNRRIDMLARMSLDTLRGVPPSRRFGVGPYAQDALSIFCEGRTDVAPADGWLRKYVEWARRAA